MDTLIADIIHAFRTAIEDELVEPTRRYLDAHARLKCATRSTPGALFRHPTVNVPCVGIEPNNSNTDDDLLRGGNMVYQQHPRRVAFSADFTRRSRDILLVWSPWPN